MFKSLSNDAEGQGLNLRPDFIDRGAVSHNAGQLKDFRDPATVTFLLYFDFERHAILMGPEQLYGLLLFEGSFAQIRLTLP